MFQPIKLLYEQNQQRNDLRRAEETGRINKRVKSCSTYVQRIDWSSRSVEKRKDKKTQSASFYRFLGMTLHLNYLMWSNAMQFNQRSDSVVK